jgi:hypothetical protein
VRAEIDITDMADDPENIELDVTGPIMQDEWTLVIGDISITARTDQVSRLRDVLCEHFGDSGEAEE